MQCREATLPIKWTPPQTPSVGAACLCVNMATLTNGRRASTRETAASLGVLVALAMVIIWLWWAQARVSPAVTVAAKAAEAGRAGTPARSTIAADLLATWPAGLRRMSPTEAFAPDTLSDKIDGKAELYLTAGFVAMRCQRIELTSTPGAWLEVFIYDMGKPENAFSVYSSQLRNATQEAGVGDYGYIAGNQLCLVHGNYYLELIAAEERAPTLRAATELARAFIAATPVTSHANVAQDEVLFPTDSIAGAVMLLSADVFGFDQLNNTYVARYREGKDEFSLYLSRRASAADAIKLATALRDFFVNDCGGKEMPAPAAPPGAVVVDSDGVFDGVFVSSSLVAGVHQAPSRASAARWMLRLSERLQTPKP